jgi:hypothetical protein
MVAGRARVPIAAGALRHWLSLLRFTNEVFPRPPHGRVPAIEKQLPVDHCKVIVRIVEREHKASAFIVNLQPREIREHDSEVSLLNPWLSGMSNFVNTVNVHAAQQHGVRFGKNGSHRMSIYARRILAMPDALGDSTSELLVEGIQLIRILHSSTSTALRSDIFC